MLDLFTAMYENFRQRITNPLLGAYASFWAIYNSEFLYYLIAADYAVSVKIDHLKEVYNQSGFFDFTVVPMAIAAVYVIVFPWVHLGVQKLQNTPAKLRLAEVASLEKARLISFEETENVKARQAHIPEFTRLEIEGDLAAKKIEVANKKRKADKLEADNIAADKLEADNIAADKLEAKKIAIKGLKAQKVAAEKYKTKKITADKVAAEKLKAKKLAAGNSPSKNNNTAARPKIHRSPTQVKKFKNTYSLTDMTNDRVHALMHYFDYDYDNKQYTALGLDEIKGKAMLANIVRFCDKWVTENKPKRKGRIPLKTLDRIAQFQKIHQYPNGKDEWHSLLSRAGPTYSENKILEIMDLDSRKV